MKTIILNGFGGTDKFELNDVDCPKVVEGHVLVKIWAAGFNPIDYQMRKGGEESARLHSPILGREFAGVVVQVGKGVTNFAVGDEVFAASGSIGSNGSYAEYISVPETILVHKPKTINFEQAAAIPVVYLTALQLVDRLNINESESIFITGAAGGVGLAFVKLLVQRKHHKIVVTAGNVTSRAVLLAAGLEQHQIIDYKSENLKQLINVANHNNLFDIAVDLVGGKLSELCATQLKLNGKYADVTALTTQRARQHLFDNGAVIYNISNYAYALHHQYQWYGNQLKRIAEMLAQKSISAPPICIFYGLSTRSVTDAHDRLETNRTQGRKLVMTIREATDDSISTVNNNEKNLRE